MTAVCVVQARAGSTRFPGKVLADLAGRPVLGFLLDRLASLDMPVVVATSDAPADDAVAEAAGVPVVRGPEDDVLARFALALDAHPADLVVRLTGDCPLADPALVTEAVEVARRTGADYVSNTLVRTFPDGLDVEVVRADVLRAAAAEARDPVEREHVTPFVYRRPGRFALWTFRSGGAFGDHRWTVDTPEDLDAVRSLVDALGRADFGWEEALALSEPEPVEGLHLAPAGPDDAGFLLAQRNEPEAVRWSRSGRVVTAVEHVEWFAGLLERPARRAWVGRVETERVGFVRVDVDDGVGDVSVAVDPAWRGKGLARELLDGLVRVLAADEQVHTLRAVVHEAHERSRRAFAAAGFADVGRDGDFVVSERAR